MNKSYQGAFVGAIGFLLIAVFLVYIGLQSPKELKNVDEITVSQMDAEYNYYIEELNVVDVYMTQTGGESGNGKYYIAALDGNDGKYYMLSLYAERGADIYDALEAYAKDSEAYYGDLAVAGCFQSKKITEDMALYYDRDAAGYIDSFKEYLDIEAAVLPLHLDYLCAAPADYEGEASERDMLYVGIVFAAISVVFLLVGFCAKRKAQLAAEERRTALEAERAEETHDQGPEF